REESRAYPGQLTGPATEVTIRRRVPRVQYGLLRRCAGEGRLVRPGQLGAGVETELVGEVCTRTTEHLAGAAPVPRRDERVDKQGGRALPPRYPDQLVRQQLDDTCRPAAGQLHRGQVLGR